jgi:hypothetical protein
VTWDSEGDDSSSSNGQPAYERPARTMLAKPLHPIRNVSRFSFVPGQSQSVPGFAYLPLGENEFRILLLAPGRRDDKIVCSFLHTSFYQPSVSYEATSYIWDGDGAMTKSKEIELRDFRGKSHSIFIRDNLHTALRTLRHPSALPIFGSMPCVSIAVFTMRRTNLNQ